MAKIIVARQWAGSPTVRWTVVFRCGVRILGEKILVGIFCNIIQQLLVFYEVDNMLQEAINGVINNLKGIFFDDDSKSFRTVDVTTPFVWFGGSKADRKTTGKMQYLLL